MKKIYVIALVAIVATISIYNITRENVRLDFFTNNFESLAEEVNNFEKPLHQSTVPLSNWTTFTVYCPGYNVTITNTQTGESKTIFFAYTGNGSIQQEYEYGWTVTTSYEQQMLEQEYHVCATNGGDFCLFGDGNCPCINN